MKYRSLKPVTYRNLSSTKQVELWLDKTTADMKVAFSLRWTDAYARRLGIRDEISCSRELRKFWGWVDRQFFGKEWEKKKIKRLIGLEKDEDKLWHIHGICDTAGSYTVEDMTLLLDYYWRKFIEIEDYNTHTQKCLTWFGERTGRYGNYAIKYAGNEDKDFLAHIGTIDIENTYLG